MNASRESEADSVLSGNAAGAATGVSFPNLPAPLSQTDEEIATEQAYAILDWERDHNRDADKADMVPFILAAITKAKAADLGKPENVSDKKLDYESEALAAMAAAVLECAQFLVTIKPSIYGGDNYIRYKDLLRNAELIHQLYRDHQLDTLTRGSFILNKICEFRKEAGLSSHPSVAGVEEAEDSGGKEP